MCVTMRELNNKRPIGVNRFSGNGIVLRGIRHTCFLPGVSEQLRESLRVSCPAEQGILFQ